MQINAIVLKLYQHFNAGLARQGYPPIFQEGMPIEHAVIGIALMVWLTGDGLRTVFDDEEMQALIQGSKREAA